MLRRLPEVSLLMVVPDYITVRCFICVYDPEACLPACSFMVSSARHYWGTQTDVVVFYCEKQSAADQNQKAAYELCSGLMTARG